ncbi:Hint domain-containing protein [Sulfitobacter albidus]|uniref:Hint domain-containing protein n=1 Tax=Sulfitobacter albidus TaxID=2829501 RepID=A0A975PLU4_9RHOB|nr:Hint domain-containing protein [Sulfitobacter albidus]QUJ76098.1 Hint domain-containing protein [Sulfitobacter albidus]
MPTTYKDQFFEIDPGTSPAPGTPVTVFRAQMTDVNDNGLIDDNDNDLFNGVQITRVWEGDTLTVNVPGVGTVTYTGTTFYLATGNPVFTPTDGQVLQNGTVAGSSFVTSSTEMDVGDFGPTCFTTGARIDVPGGMRRIEEIAVGDLVETLDDGAQPVRAILRQTVRAYGAFAPIHFAAGALGQERAFAVSPEHRMLIADWRAALLMGCDEALVAAKHLVNGTSVQRIEGGSVTYIHLVFDDHQIVTADGCQSESCLPDPALIARMDPKQVELLQLFGAESVRTVAHRAEAICLRAA